MCGDDQNENIEVESIKDLPDVEQVELIAEKFAEVANLYEPLDRTKISVPEYREKDVPVVSAHEVKEIETSTSHQKFISEISTK